MNCISSIPLMTHQTNKIAFNRCDIIHFSTGWASVSPKQNEDSCFTFTANHIHHAVVVDVCLKQFKTNDCAMTEHRIVYEVYYLDSSNDNTIKGACKCISLI